MVFLAIPLLVVVAAVVVVRRKRSHNLEWQVNQWSEVFDKAHPAPKTLPSHAFDNLSGAALATMHGANTTTLELRLRDDPEARQRILATYGRIKDNGELADRLDPQIKQVLDRYAST